MIVKRFILPLCLIALLFAACDESEEAGQFVNWRERNEAFVDSLQQVVDAKTDPNLYRIQDSRDKTSYIYFKKIVEKTEGQAPYYTSNIKVFYREMLMDEAVFGTNPSEKFYTRLYNQLTVTESNFTGDNPSEYDSPKDMYPWGYYSGSSTVAVINGRIEIMQWMKPGERWEVYIPYKSGYGTSGSGSIPGYSTLICDITLVSVTEY